MKRKIVADSCCDLNASLKRAGDIVLVPFPIEIDDYTYLDNDQLDISDFLKRMAASPNKPRTAGPSPLLFYNALNDAEEGFIVTISSKLSVTHSNARLAADEYMADHPGSRVHVFDSRSAVSGEAAVAEKLAEWIAQGLSFEEIVERGEAFIERLKTYFVLEDLSTLVKSGRIPKLAGSVASRLSIVPICSGERGEIKVNEIKRGMKRALARLVEIVTGDPAVGEDHKLYIVHINDEPRALELRDQIQAKGRFKAIEVIRGGGLSSVYANQSGIVVAY